MKNTVRTFDKHNNLVYEANFITADAAYKEYKDIINNLKAHLPKGFTTTVVRYVDECVMTTETIIGNC